MPSPIFARSMRRSLLLSSISGTRSNWCCKKRLCRNSLVVLFYPASESDVLKVLCNLSTFRQVYQKNDLQQTRPERTDMLCFTVSEIWIWRIDNNQVNLSIFQKFYTVDRSCIRYFDVGSRKFLVETFQVRNKEITADSVTGTDAKLSYTFRSF